VRHHRSVAYSISVAYSKLFDIVVGIAEKERRSFVSRKRVNLFVNKSQSNKVNIVVFSRFHVKGKWLIAAMLKALNFLLIRYLEISRAQNGLH